jgi:hypothetical protein
LLVARPGLTVKALRTGHRTTEEGVSGTVVGFVADPLHPYLVELEPHAPGTDSLDDEVGAQRMFFAADELEPLG